MNDPHNDPASETSDIGYKDLNSPMIPYATSGATKKLSKETTLDVPLPALYIFHNDDEGAKPKLVIDESKKDTPAFVLGDNMPTPDISHQAVEQSHGEDEGGKPKPIIDESTTTTNTPTFVLDGNMATVDISLAAVKESHDDDEGGEPKHVINDSLTDTATTLDLDDIIITLDISHPLQASNGNDEDGETKHVIDESPTDTVTTLILGDTKETLDVKNELSDVEVWDDGSPLSSSGHTCSQWQTTDHAHSSRVETISIEVSTAGCLPQCEETRSGCVNIESVMPSEQVNHLPTTIKEDDANIAGNEGFPQFQTKVEGNSNYFNGIYKSKQIPKQTSKQTRLFR